MSVSTRPPRLLERPPRDELDAEARAMIEGAEELLPDAVRARVWEGFIGRLEGPTVRRARGRRWLAVAAGITAAAAIVLAVLRLGGPPDPPDGRALEVRGEAVVAEGTSGWRPLDLDEEFDVPARLRVEDGASAEVRLARGVDIRIDGPAALRVEPRGVSMESGRAAHDVPKGHGRWVVQLGAYSVIVQGTQFWTGRSGSDAAVCLLEGKVRIERNDEVIARLDPGEAWRSSAHAPAFPTDLACRLGGSADRGRLAEVREVPRTTATVASEPAEPVLVPPTGESATADAQSMHAEGASAPTASAGSRASATHDAASTQSATAATGAVAAREPAPPADEVPPTPLAPMPARSSTELPLPEAPPTPARAPEPEPERAPCVGAPDPEGCFRRLADGADLRAQAALLRLGEIRRARGNSTGALDAWLEYRRRFPSGALAQEADLSILEMRLRLGQPQALRAAERFLEHWRGSEHTAEVTAIRGVLRRRAGDCAGALTDFDRALSARLSSGRREEALYGRAVCLQAAGRVGDATNAYRAYLREHPAGRFAARAHEALGTPDAGVHEEE